MLDDGDGGTFLGIELGDELVGRVGVVEIVIGQRLALDLHGRADAEMAFARAVESRPLMRVLAVAQHLGKPAGHRLDPRRRLAELAAEPSGDGRIIGSGRGERVARERLAQRGRRRPAIRFHLGEHGGIVGGVDHDGDALVVLRRRPDHGWAADIDILDAGFEVRARRDGLLEGIEIDDEEVDRRNCVLGERPLMRFVPAHGEQAAVNPRMQRLDASVHHLGALRDLGDVGHRDPGIAQGLRRSPGRDDLDAMRAQGMREIGETRLVADRQQRAGNLSLIHQA